MSGDGWLGEIGAIAGIAGEAAVAAGKGVAAGALGGPAGMAAGGLVGLASAVVPHVFGDDAKPALAAAAQAITGAAAEPEQVQEIATDPAKLDAFRVQALQIAQAREAARDQARVDAFRVQVADVADARAHPEGVKPWLAVVVIALLASCLAVLMLRAVPDGTERLVNVTLGALIAAFNTVVAYYFGSSAGSAAKTNLLARRGRGA